MRFKGVLGNSYFRFRYLLGFATNNKMFKREKPLPLKSSASLLCNNLTVLNSAERGFLNYAVIHKYLINMICTSTDGSQVTHRQVICKEPSATQQGTSMVMQARWVVLKNRSVLVLTSLKGIQMFEHDGSAMLYWHALSDVSGSDTVDQSNFGRGIAGVSDNNICVGTQDGKILVFEIPAKGTNVNLVNTLQGHRSAICDLASDGGNTLLSTDEEGNILTWKNAAAAKQPTDRIQGSGDPCSSLSIWKGIVVGAFGNGQIKVYDLATGKLGACVNAHARWINAVDIAKNSGMVVSASEDSFVRVWQLVPGPVPGIEFVFGECVTDQQLVGAQFIHDEGRGLCVTGYDCNDLTFFIQS